MPDGLEERALQEGAVSRGWLDTRVCCHHWLFWVVETFGGGAVGMFVSPACGLIFIAAVLAAIFIVNVALAPRRQRNEVRALLKIRLDQQADIHVTVPLIFTKNPADLLHLQFSQDGLAIILRDIRFTNRSITHNVSLNLTLMVPGRGGYYRVEEEKVYWKILPDYLIFSPIGIAPGGTQSGDVCFLVSPETVRKCGGKWKLNYKQCRLKIFDTVSEKKMDKDISQEALESQQIMRDTPVWYNEE